MKNKILLFTSAASLVLSGCSTMDGFSGGLFEQTQFTTAQVEEGVKVEYVPVPIPVAKPYLKKLPDLSKEMVRAKKVSPAKAIKDARKEALQVTTPAGFINAMQIFDYMPGALYEIYASKGYVTSILLKPGEQVIKAMGGDTVRWTLGNTYMGAGKDKRTVILLKPKVNNHSTNVMITTDQRIYMIEAKAYPGGVYNASVTWNYPEDDFRDLEMQAIGDAVKEEQIVAGNVNIHDLNYNYAIQTMKGNDPDWMPLEAFDDGNKTYIRFSNDLGKTKAPVLYVLSFEGKAEIVNYRVRGNFYVIDRIISAAELRMGSKHQKIVRISKRGSGSFFNRLLGKRDNKQGGFNS